MAVEKTIRVFVQIPDVKADTANLVSSFYTRVSCCRKNKASLSFEYTNPINYTNLPYGGTKNRVRIKYSSV